MSTNRAEPITDGQPKRVILRLRYNDFEDDDNSHMEAVKVYLAAAGRKADEYNRYVSHVEPRQDYMEGDSRASFHVILDIEKDAIRKPDIDKLPHEIYRIRRQNEDALVISRLPDRWLQPARRFTDIWYGWGEI
ncbi:hypothetical protein ACRALDRAFT_1078288 [Sodiomyces alcalophilus JCM 7366]|uniref:uncharacterized protein n=1 Tax=Sodiomyces alcalophilus JCM 7366 TaxID=591952 RepID=UPI0039B6D230